MGFKKGEKITDPKILARLKLAREKAMETRMKNADARRKAKLEKETRMDEFNSSSEEELPPKKKRKMKPPSSSDDDEKTQAYRSLFG